MNYSNKALKLTPMVSITLPVYNAEHTLVACLESLLNQTYTHFEILAGDDGSSDQSLEILRRYEKLDKRLRVFNFPHRGLVPTINELIHNATGSFIARQDADDLSYPNRLEEQVHCLQTQPKLEACATQVRLFREDAEVGEGHKRYVSWCNALLSLEQMYQQRFTEQPLVHPTVMLRNDVYKKYGLYRWDENHSFPEDYDFWLRALSKGITIKKIDKVLYDWRDSEKRLTRSHSHYSQEAFFRCRVHHLKIYIQELCEHRSSKESSAKLYFWGAGAVTRRRFRPLFDFVTRHEIVQQYFQEQILLELSEKLIGKTLDKMKVQSCLEKPDFKSGRDFIFILVGGHGVREKIMKALNQWELVEGRDFLFCSF